MRRPVRVLHVIDGLGGGGSERWIWDIVRLSDKDRTVYRVVPIHFDRGRFVYAERLRAAGALGPRKARSRRPERRIEWPVTTTTRQTLAERSQTFRRVRISLWHNLCVFPAAAARLLAACASFRPDVLHAHTFYGLIAGLWASRLLRRPLIYTVPSSFQHIEQADYGWILDVCKTSHPRIDRFLTNYPNELRGLGVPSAKITTIRAAVDMGRLRVSSITRADYRESLRARLGVSRDGLLALTVGRLSPEKGHRYGLQALPIILDRYPSFHWAVLGEGGERAELEAMASELRVTDRVHFVGFLEDPLPWYFASDIYLRTHVVEGDNLSSVQAMAAALPVAGFDTGSEAEMIREVGHGLLATNRDAEAFARAVLALIGSGDGNRLGELGNHFASANLDTVRVVDRCQEIYDELAGRVAEAVAPA